MTKVQLSLLPRICGPSRQVVSHDSGPRTAFTIQCTLPITKPLYVPRDCTSREVAFGETENEMWIYQ